MHSLQRKVNLNNKLSHFKYIITSYFVFFSKYFNILLFHIIIFLKKIYSIVSENLLFKKYFLRNCFGMGNIAVYVVEAITCYSAKIMLKGIWKIKNK